MRNEQESAIIKKELMNSEFFIAQFEQWMAGERITGILDNPEFENELFAFEDKTKAAVAIQRDSGISESTWGRRKGEYLAARNKEVSVNYLIIAPNKNGVWLAFGAMNLLSYLRTVPKLIALFESVKAKLDTLGVGVESVVAVEPATTESGSSRESKTLTGCLGNAHDAIVVLALSVAVLPCGSL